MISSGTPQTTISTLVECDQSGVYFALVLPARKRQANTKVSTMAGITTISIRPMQIRIRSRWASPTMPFESSSTQSQPDRPTQARATSARRMRFQQIFIGGQPC